MTIGEKIKYLRKKIGITQNELAERTGIHPVSIRKYETNKMIPQPAQISRISSALSVSPLALTDLTNTEFDKSSRGDMLAVLILLYNSKLLILHGERNANGKYIKESLTISFSPELCPILGLSLKNNALSLEDIKLELIDEFILERFIGWEQVYYLRNEAFDEWQDEPSATNKERYSQLCNLYDEIELAALLPDTIH